MTHKTILCARTGCTNNEAGKCKLEAPTILRREGVDAYSNCLDQVNKPV